MPKHFSFRFQRPQQVAAALLLLLMAQSLWVEQRQTLTVRDYEFARCGREMWEMPSPLAGYFTSCGNIHDGTLGYRVAGLPLTVARLAAGVSKQASTWELHRQMRGVLFLVHSGFLFFGLCLGAALWWVTRRLYGNTGGFLALALYCFSPPVIQACTYPNNEILTAFGFFAVIYTAIGVAHALQGPRKKWPFRIALFTLALGFTAAAHVSAFLVAIPLSILLLGYLAVGRREAIVPVMSLAIPGALFLVFASYAFQPDAFSYYFRSGAGRLWLTTRNFEHWFVQLPNAAVSIAVISAFLIYLTSRRSRYFGNTLPLAVAVLLLFLATPGISSETSLWALPFLLTFIAGVFADALEGQGHRVFSWATATVLALGVALGVLSLPASFTWTPQATMAPKVPGSAASRTIH